MQILHNIPINGTRYKKGRIEKDFETEVFGFLRKHGYFCYHIPDVGLCTRLVDGIQISPEGVIFLIEFKITDGYTFNMSQFEEGQIRVLEFCRARGAPAYVMIYSTKTQTYITTTYEYLKSQANSVGGIKIFEKGTSTLLPSK